MAESTLSAPSAAGLSLASFAAACILLLALAAPSALATDEHVYDPALSLSGGTGTTVLDPVPDPGPSHPAKTLNDPCGVTTDDYGNVYVANGASGTIVTSDGVIDVFGPDGEFITEVRDENNPCSVAVDSTGKLYVFENTTGLVVRYDPLVYEPATGEIEYDPEPTVIAGDEPGAPDLSGMGLDPSNDHLYLSHGELESKHLFEELLPDGSLAHAFTEDVFADPQSMAIWGQSHDLYTTGSPRQPDYQPFNPHVYVVDATTHEVKLTLDGSNTPDGDFGFSSGRSGIAVDQFNGDIYVDAIDLHHAVDQFDNAGDFIGQLKLPSNGLKASSPFNGIAVDQGAHSPNQGYVYVTSGETAVNSHLYAFAPRDVKPPEVRDAHIVEAGESEAHLAGEVNPNGAATTYRFEYGAADCASNPCQNAPVPGGSAGAGAAFKEVSASIAGLTPGATYHFRIIATSHCNSAEPAEECVVESPDGTFETFSPALAEACPNASLRVGPSAGLPDCRAYELVTPPDTNGRIPTGGVFRTALFGAAPVLLISPGGGSAVFGVEGGSLPGDEGGGYLDTYRSTRGPSGWSTEFGGLTGAQAAQPFPSGVSADHTYSSWKVERGGTLAKGEYLRGPGGTTEEVGIGSFGTGEAHPYWISPGAAHLIFESKVQLEPNAPPSGTLAVYDRSPGGPTHVVSLLPADVTPGAGQDAGYLGAAAQGNAVAFNVGNTIYERIGNAETVKVVDGPAAFGGISANGSRVFYLRGGNVFAFESATQTTTPVGSGGQSTMVNVSPDGSHVYFVSPLVLSGTEANSQGAKAAVGAKNLYAWDTGSGTVRFIASVTEEDVIGEVPVAKGSSSGRVGGLGLWTSDAVNPAQFRNLGPANDPSRTTDDGSVFVFETRARLTDYDNQGRSEVYRYVSDAGEIGCVSCNPTGPPVSGSLLESRYAPFPFSIPPVNALSLIANVSGDGGTVFFQSADRLAAGDVDRKIDVYEWLAQGTHGCDRAAGCIRLISSGHSAGDDYLYGASEDGSSVFFLSSDSLVPEDPDATPSIYVARTDGGFPPVPPPPGDCLGEACQPAVAAPDDVTPGSSTVSGPGNPGSGGNARCPKGKHKVRAKGGRSRCAKPHAKHSKKQQRRNHTNGKTAR